MCLMHKKLGVFLCELKCAFGLASSSPEKGRQLFILEIVIIEVLLPNRVIECRRVRLHLFG